MNLFNIYKHCPISIQNLLCNIKGYQIDKQRYGIEYDQIFESLLESDFWTKDKIKLFKEERIYNILNYAYHNCKYYTNRFQEYGLTPSSFTCLEDLNKFPILTKEDVRNHWKEMISKEFKLKDLISYHTSGSTGKALAFYWHQSNLKYYWATVWRGRQRFDINKGDKHINFTGKLVVPLEQQKPPYWRHNKFINQYMLNTQHMTAAKSRDIIDFINHTKWDFFVGYPSIINSLAVLVEEQNLEIKASPKYIFTSAEKLYDYQRDMIEKIFNADVIEHYGFSENAGCASKCENKVYHEDFELGHFELNNSVTVNDGEIGSLLATGFHNLAMPFIRYEVGDTAKFTDVKCTCGRHSQVIANIDGRNEDYILTPEGVKIMRVSAIFKNTKTIKECQVIQETIDSLHIRIVKREGYSFTIEKEIIKAVKELVSTNMTVHFSYLDQIPRTKAGKFKFVISKLSNK
ncbi:phenylacetate--CoA ligase family protein [Bacteroides sp.]|uniref:phenylacetate--CoA ligase family protein n=1 Tax=Bacteroides sp. TaxID=29523 RepID=UPI0025827808|nr:phenylacetate--CoA ligase family protein [Bacteroides sp.]